MKKDIPTFKVQDLAVAIVPREDADSELWDVYAINLRDEPITNVLINSRGYGEMNGEQMKTTVFRHFFEHFPPLHVQLVEPIHVRLFDLSNEYWISFSYDDYMYDKKYIFVKGSIKSENFTRIPFLDRQGVMIR